MKNNNELNDILDVVLSNWKLLTISVVMALVCGYTYLRYADYEYFATATIKIKDEKQSQKLPSIREIAKEGLFSDGTNKIKDQIELIKSRNLLKQVVEDLNLNVSIITQGNVKESELYKKPPLSLSFFESDSIVHSIDTTLYIRIKSPTEYLIFKEDVKKFTDRDINQAKLKSFGEKLETGFGGIIITPNNKIAQTYINQNFKIILRNSNSIVSSLQEKLKFVTEEGSSIVKLELNLKNSYKAVDILNTLIGAYNEDALNDKNKVIKVTSDFINKRLERVSEELEQVDFTAEKLQKQNKLTGLGAQTNLNLKAEKELQSEISNTSNKIQMISFLEEEIDATDKVNELLPTEIGLRDANINLLTKSFNQLVVQRDKLLENSTEQNPVVVNLNNQIKALKSNLKSSLNAMKETSQLTLTNLGKEENRIRSQIYRAPTQARQFRNIERQQGIKESLYLFLLEKREESTIQLGMYSPVAKIVDKAYSSHLPVSPNPLMTYIASFLAGLGLPILLLYTMSLLDTKLYTKKDLIENLNDIPFIGDIPKTAKKEKLIRQIDYSPKAEAFRIVRSNLDFMLKNVKNRGKKIFITSTKAQEGKSHTSTNLSNSISFSEKKVLLIEMDIRVPKIIDYLGIKLESNKGLSDYIADLSLKPTEVIHNHPENKYLDILPSGSIPPNPSELLMSDRVDEIFAFAEKNYDYIIVDTSAVGLVSDTLLISDHADMFIYVVSANGVDRRQLIHVAQPLYDDKRLPNMTLLLNGVKSGKKGYGYGYGYGNNPNKKKKWYQFSKS
ncbi:GumC family protein [Winogradskyella poriferorum]|uniref:GumC family protein n=1 Tax=Winogradskyella poriferorum TaxID=307627 RepID=UPI003D650D2D